MKLRFRLIRLGFWEQEERDAGEVDGALLSAAKDGILGPVVGFLSLRVALRGGGSEPAFR